LWCAARTDTFSENALDLRLSIVEGAVRRALLGAFAALILAGACVSGQRQRLSPGIRDQNRLQADELVSLGPNLSMYEVINRLRHRWMEPRSPDPAIPEATDQIGVYAGNELLGSLNELRYIQARNVASARFIEPREAAALYGPGHASGVIVLELKR